MRALQDVPAPGKLNLFLHVTGRRADGYHLLQSVFMLIDWQDRLDFEWRPGGRLSREDHGATLPEDDLCLRAARALQQASGTTQGVHITLTKRLPSQAGLGGGSSDAATCLLALNRLWDLGLSRSALQTIGLSLGADVPFFLGGRNAWVEGVGEQITPIDLPPARFVVVQPDQGLETARIFCAPELRRDTRPATISGFAADPYVFGCNDLQPVAQRLCPGVTQALAWLSAQGLKPRMTGSGSAVFARWPDPFDAFPCKPPPGWTLQVCSNLSAHPLEGWANSDR
jgi:4-diphosphocytidyl-2-C-methyl-D-erythritol kinase